LARIERACGGADEENPAASARASLSDARDRVARAHGAARAGKGESVAPADAALYDALVAWRLGQSRAANAPAYVIFSNSTLAAIATARPRSQPALLGVSGVGPVKVERYGSAVLDIVAEHSRVAAT
jgi:superfamily II DNA helicase RecQ